MMQDKLFWGMILTTPSLFFLFYISAKYIVYDNYKEKLAFIVLPVINLVLIFIVFYLYQKPSYDVYDSLKASLTLNFVLLPVMIYLLQFYILKSKFKDNDSFVKYTNPKCMEVLKHHNKPRQAYIYSYLLRYLSMAFCVFIAIYYFANAQPTPGAVEAQGWFQYIVFITTGILAFSLTWLICVFKVYIKCEACDLEVFFPDKYMSLIFRIARLAVVEKVLVCYHCHSAYSLDKEINLDQVKCISDKFWVDEKERTDRLAGINT